ncbi:hypothetical protein [Vibrio sp. 10N.261.51.F12]|uniref:hypothetical protein n=1 Tax=Vibrio sp. 10N.261.51.F12 TaxID=3229679 RepID=UPI003551CF95
MRVSFLNEFSGATKEVKCGFSWTTFFFGFMPDILRGNWKGAAIGAVIWLLAITTFVMIIGLIAWCFFRNKELIKFYEDHGGWLLNDKDKRATQAYINRAIRSEPTAK